jgi:hypothetical protein
MEPILRILEYRVSLLEIGTFEAFVPVVLWCILAAQLCWSGAVVFASRSCWGCQHHHRQNNQTGQPAGWSAAAVKEAAAEEKTAAQ